MDRASLVRMSLRWLILAGVLVQATTPDLLDLSLLSQSLPPGPVFAVAHLSLRVSARRQEPSPDALADPLGEPSPSTLHDDGPQDDLCEPLWPEIGLMRKRPTGAESWLDACMPRATGALRHPALAVALHEFPAKAAVPPDVRCRLTC